MRKNLWFILGVSVALLADYVLGTDSTVQLAILGGLMNSIFNDSSSMYENAINQLQDKKREVQAETNAGQIGIQRASYQDAINRTMDALKQQNAKLAGTSVVAGGTDEALQAQKEANAQAMAKGISNAAVQAEAQDMALAKEGRTRTDQLDSQITNMNFQKDQAKANAIAGVAAGLDAAEGIAAGGLFSSLFSKTK